MADGEVTTVELGARRIPPPAGISEAARAVLAMPRPAGGAYPALDDADSWRRLIAARNKGSAEMSAPFAARLRADVVARPMAGVSAYEARPQGERLLDDRHVVFDIHGGALLFGGTEPNVRFSTAANDLRCDLCYGAPPRWTRHWSALVLVCWNSCRPR